MSLELAPDYKDIADRLIDKFPVAFGHIEMDKVLFLRETEKSPKKYADVRKVASPYTFMTEYKFIITFYEGPLLGLSQEQKIMVVYHELLHIDVDFNKLKKHNIEDFRELVSIYGVNWTIDPNLPNILEDEEDIPSTTTAGSDENDNEEEPEIL